MVPALLLALGLAVTGASLPAEPGAASQLTGVVREADPTPGCAFSGGGVICGGQHPSGEPLPARTMLPPADPTPSPSASTSDPATTPVPPAPAPPATTPTPTIGDESASDAPVQNALAVLAGGILLLGAGLLAASWWRGRHGDGKSPGSKTEG